MYTDGNVGEEQTNNNIYEYRNVISYFLLHVWRNISHIGIHHTTETDNRDGSGERIADGNRIEHQQEPSARHIAYALVECQQVDHSVENVLMEQGIRHPLPDRASGKQPHILVSENGKEQYYSVPHIKRNLRLLNS